MRQWMNIVSEDTETPSDEDLYYYVVGKVRDNFGRRVTIDGYIENGTIHIDLISVENTRQGLGTEVMQEICFNADDYHVAIELEAGSHGRAPK